MERWRWRHPCDYRLSDKPVDGVTKNEHFRAMLQTASDRGVQPRSVAFDSWSSSLGAYEDRPRQRLALADAPE